MSAWSIVALVVLAAIVTVLVAIAAIRLGREWQPDGHAASSLQGPRWFELLLAVVLLVLLIVVVITGTSQLGSDGAAVGDWRASTRSSLFLGVMLALAAFALLFLLLFLLARNARRLASHDTLEIDAEAAAVTQPAASRLAGLAVLGVGVLLLGWVYLVPAQRAALVTQVLYPASIAVALVLLFDKATRSWTPKEAAEGIREWLLCDVVVIALVLGFVNVQQLEDPSTYAGFFWDVVHIAAFFLVFWCLDRTAWGGRFLVGFGYLTLLPALLVVWRWAQEIEAVDGLSWWSTVWPIFFLSLAFFVLEIISLLALRNSRGQLLPAVKDAIFVVVYAAFLIAAVPAAE